MLLLTNPKILVVKCEMILICTMPYFDVNNNRECLVCGIF